MRGKALLKILGLVVVPVFCFGQQPQAAPEAEGATLKVDPGPAVIKQKDLYEGTGLFRPLARIPGYVLHDEKSILTSPFHTSRANAKWWVIFGTATAALIATDKNTVKQLPNSPTQISVSKWGSRIGSAYSLIPISAAFYVAGTRSHQERLRETGLLSFEALIDSNITVQLIKTVADRARPYEGNGTGRFENSVNSRWSSSFPSGHAINAWALASVVAHQYRHTRIVPIVAYGLASVVVLARVGAQQHFPGDVVVGSAMGWFIGDYVYGKRHNRSLDAK